MVHATTRAAMDRQYSTESKQSSAGGSGLDRQLEIAGNHFHHFRGKTGEHAQVAACTTSKTRTGGVMRELINVMMGRCSRVESHNVT